ncbi:Uma2 family endonuclease [Bernardetia sp. Wsw4-3y2]|uniref:Uma2 family endonuclease n=1 Tax=Bernardetia sp. Wsw4-3y2 TaxID=3127471 RepID=UPI0030D3127F
MNNYQLELTEEQEKLLIPLLEALKIDFRKEVVNNKNGSTQPLPSPLTQKSDYTVEEIEEYAALFPKKHIWKSSDIETYFPQDLKVSVQIIQNQLFIMPSPNFNHQAISEELGFQMGTFVRQHKAGKIIYAPIDVQFDEDNLFQPDIIFIAVSRYHIIENKKVQEAPNLVVEIWSPSNAKKEREMKHKIYETQGVTEYWQIFPKKREVKVEVLNEEGKYKLFSEAKKVGKVQSKVLNGFEIEIETLFEEVDK